MPFFLQTPLFPLALLWFFWGSATYKEELEQPFLQALEALEEVRCSMCNEDWLVLLPAAPYRLVAFPFTALFHHLCASGHLFLAAWHIFPLAGGMVAAMSSYAVLLLIPTAGSVLILLSISPACVHTWVFALQMPWQTLCHVGLSGQELDPQDARPAIALSMLLTQEVPSLALGIHESLVLPQLGRGLLWQVLSLHSYLFYFPVLLRVHSAPSAGSPQQPMFIIAYALVAVEAESFSMLCLLWTSCDSILPLSYGITLLLLLLAKKPKQN